MKQCVILIQLVFAVALPLDGANLSASGSHESRITRSIVRLPLPEHQVGECSDSLTPADAAPTDSWWDKVEVSGHVRVRHESDFERIDRPTRNRGRLRARLGFNYLLNSEFKCGIRWTTGDRKLVLETDDRGGSPLSYQDTGDVFDKFEFNLDRIFITYNPDWLPEFYLTGGKFRHTARPNPIFASPVGDLVWDEAAHPEGIAGWYTWKNPPLFDELFLTLGESVVLELSNQDEASLFYAQMWVKKACGRFAVETGITWYDWNSLNPDGNTTVSTENNSGNSVTQVGIDTTPVGVDAAGNPVVDGRPLFVFDSGFNIINPIAVVTYDDGDECSGIHPIQFVWEVFHNFEAFDDARDTGFSIGVQYGPAVTRQEKHEWKFYYTWNEVEQESVFTPVGQDDFQRATNFRGHWIGLDVYLRQHLEARFWLLSDTPIISAGGSRETEWRGRVDVTVYF